MRKKDLLLFLDKVEHKAIKSVEEHFDKLIDVAKINVLAEKKYTERIEKLQKKVNNLFAEAQELTLDIGEDIDIKFSYYYTVPYDLQHWNGKSNIYDSILKHSRFSAKSVETLKQAKNKEVDAVKANYLKVRVVCERLANGAKVAEYLEGIGFDISSIKDIENKALIPQIDKTKLFVCGENK